MVSHYTLHLNSSSILSLNENNHCISTNTFYSNMKKLYIFKSCFLYVKKYFFCNFKDFFDMHLHNIEFHVIMYILNNMMHHDEIVIFFH